MQPNGHSQNGNQNPGNGEGAGNGAGEGAGAGAQGTQTPPAGQQQQTGSDQFNPESLTQEQINQVLEKNPHIWNAERIAGLRDKAKKFDDAQAAAEEAENKRLEDEGKFKDLSDKQKTQIEDLQGQIRDRDISSALTTKLVPLGVVDLEGALKLVDRSKIEVKEDGSITGVDEAVEALKTGKAYLFNENGGGTAKVGTASNPGNGGNTNGNAKFKRSQLQDPKFYQENREAILKAQAAGEIEDDISR